MLARPATIVERPEATVLLSAARAGNRLVAVGERGIITVSEDNGRRWRQIPTPTSVTLTAVTFASPVMGWAVGHSGIVLKTRDGGLSWFRQLDASKAAHIAQLSAAQASGPKAAGLRSLVQLLGPDSPFLTVAFTSVREGIVAGGNGFIFKTIDGGDTWTSLMPLFDNSQGLHYYSLGVRGERVWLAGEEGRFFISRDGGRSYNRLKLPYDGTFFAVSSAREHEFIVAGLRGNVFFSNDDGRTIRRLKSPVPISISSVAVRRNGSYLLTTQAGNILEYHRGQSKLRQMPTPPLAPLSGAVETADGSIVAVGFGGVTLLPRPGTAAGSVGR